jgi:excisionase family DNA binding protein
MEELLTVKEASKVLKCGLPYLYKIINAGLLPYMKLGHIKIRRSAIDEFILKYENMDLSNLDDITPLKGENYG